MADLAYWAVVCGAEGFETACAANRQNALEVMLSYDPLAKTVRASMADQNQWDGNMEKLLDIVGQTAGIKKEAVGRLAWTDTDAAISRYPSQSSRFGTAYSRGAAR
jgi:hypothetical protein